MLSSLRAGQPLSRGRVERLLNSLAGLSDASDRLATYYLPRDVLADVAGHIDSDGFQRNPGWRRALERASERALDSPTGLAVFRVGDAGLAIQPPFPLQATAEAEGIDSGPLLSLLATRFTVGVALVRLGRYAIAVYEGERLAVSKTDTRYVKSKHHAGGTSQRRFQRVRENQIHRLFVEASSVLERQWQPWLDRLDHVALGGEAATVNGFVKECNLLARLAPITLGRRLDVREPNRAALDKLGTTLYECRVYPFRWDV